MKTLVLGGIRSGKSRWAEAAIAESLAPDQPVSYVATGSSTDADATWSRRIAEHRKRRPAHWSTVQTRDVAAQLHQFPDTPTLVDDLGAWLTALLDRKGWDGGAVATDVDQLLSAVEAFNSPLMLVSPEVGLTVVSATAAGRRFTDELGTLNQRLASCCDRVFMVLAGQAVPIKPSTTGVGF